MTSLYHKVTSMSIIISMLVVNFAEVLIESYYIHYVVTMSMSVISTSFFIRKKHTCHCPVIISLLGRLTKSSNFTFDLFSDCLLLCRERNGLSWVCRCTLFGVDFEIWNWVRGLGLSSVCSFINPFIYLYYIILLWFT